MVMQFSIPRRAWSFVPVLLLTLTGCRSTNLWQPPCLSLNNGGAYLHSPLPFVRTAPAVNSDLQDPAIVRGRSRVVPAPLPPESNADDSGVAGTGYRPNEQMQGEENFVKKLTEELDELPTTNVPPRSVGPALGKTDSTTELQLSVESNETSPISGEVTFKIRLTNTGNHKARDIVIQCDFEEGLAFPGKEERGIIQRMGELAPGESREVELSLMAKSEGSPAAIFTARSTNVDAIKPVTRKVTIIPQSLFLELTGAGNARVGDRLTYRLTVRNSSDRPLKNVRVLLTADKSLKPISGEGNPEQLTSGWVWKFGEFPGGESRNYAVILECTSSVDAAEINVEGNADGIPGDTLRATIEVLPTPKPPMTRLGPMEIDLGMPESF